MNAAIAVAQREVRERRSLLATALIVGLLPIALWATDPSKAGQTHPPLLVALGELLALFLYVAFPTAVALAVGASILGRDLAEGRLGFYFARPISAAALWAGKFLGAAVLVLVSFVACAVSLQVVHRTRFELMTLMGAFLALLFLMSAAHVISATYRSRSPWFALDLVLAAVFVACLGAQLRHLMLAGAESALVWGFGFGLHPSSPWRTFGVPTSMMAAATSIMLAAAFAQLAFGRADGRRGHAALSATLWPLAFVGLGAFALWGAWVLRVTPADLGGASDAVAPPRGAALFFHGAQWQGRAGFSPVFLMNGEDRSYLRLPADRTTEPTFTADGTMAGVGAGTTAVGRGWRFPGRGSARPSASGDR